MSGYVVDGNIYESKICFGNFNCKFATVYSANSIQQNAWNWGTDATYGILGMAPNSYIWESFIEESTKTATYSIELARIKFFSEDQDAATSVQSNITFGSANNANYLSKTNMTAPALSNWTYALNNFAFGKTYQTNGVDSSSFFYQLSNWFPVLFSTNFKGIGLPSTVYA